jgi:hypothetical protein
MLSLNNYQPLVLIKYQMMRQCFHFMSYMLVSYKTFISYMCMQQPLRLRLTIFYGGLNPRTNID